jgi:hypothetical protein
MSERATAVSEFGATKEIQNIETVTTTGAREATMRHIQP